MPEESKRPLKVFLCHASADKTVVRGLYQRLIKDGVDAWLDKEKLLAGQDWELEIRRAVRAADVVVVCLSKQFNQAGFRQKEVRLALDTAMEKSEGEIFIIPARLEECETLESLRKWHWVDLFEEDGHDRLIRALLARANNIGVILRIRKSRTPKNRKTNESITTEKDTNKTNGFEPININSNSVIKTSLPEKVEELKKTRTKKEEIEKRRLPYFETLRTRNNVTQQDNENSTNIVKRPEDDTSLSESSASLEFPESGEQHSSKKSNRKRPIRAEYIVAVIGAAATIIAGILGSPVIENWFSPAPTATEASTATITLTMPPVTPSQTIEPSPVLTETITPTATPYPTEITDVQGVTMRLVPEGEFTMGNLATNANNFCENMTTHIINYGSPCKMRDYHHEEPIHKVFLSDYFVDVFEVSNVEYKKCVSAGICFPPSSNNANRYSKYYNNDYLLTYPVLNVTWEMARKYCEWRGARLPTEAEWEKAARGIDERLYPWGNSSNAYIYETEFYDDRANVNLNPGFSIPTVPVSSNSKGLSPYGMYNMAGNVAEWVYDWYGEKFYSISPYENPTGPTLGDYRVIRGGSVNDYDVRTTARGFLEPTKFSTGVGFRCVKSVP